METKQLQWNLWFVLFIASVVYFNIVGLGNLGVFAVTSAYTIFGAVALIVLRSTKSDEPYYVNLNLSGLAVSVGVGGGMVAVAVVFSIVLGVGAVGQSLVPTSFVQSASSLSGISLSALTC